MYWGHKLCQVLLMTPIGIIDDLIRCAVHYFAARSKPVPHIHDLLLLWILLLYIHNTVQIYLFRSWCSIFFIRINRFSFETIKSGAELKQITRGEVINIGFCLQLITTGN